MCKEEKPLSNHIIRNKIYQLFLAACHENKKNISDVIRLGERLMWWSGVHPHFFGNNALRYTAEFLTFYALQLPIESNSRAFSKIKLSYINAKNIIQLFERRIADRIPVEYLTNEARYLDYRFYVNEHVLIPRSLMNTRFRDFLNETTWHNYRVLDLCTGSGCIGISLALLHPDITVDLADISSDALAVAAKNIAKHGLSNRVHCIQSNVFANIKDQYDLIISNPPYVSKAEYNRCPKEFKREPKLALESGRDGLDLIRQILKNAKDYLNPDGKLIVEVGMPAVKRIKKHYRHIPFKWYKYRTPAGGVSPFISPGVFEVSAANLE